MDATMGKTTEAGASRDLGHGISFGEAFRVWLRVAVLSFGGPAGQIAVMHRILVEEFGLATPPLLRLAAMVRGADTGRLDLSPEAPGLLAASLGLSRMFDDDLEQLEAGMLLYDAFYRWCRDATGETHNWPTNKAKP